MTESASRRTARWSVLLTALAVIALAALILWPTPQSTVLLPSPNGYDQIVKVGTLLADLPGDYRQVPEAQLRHIVASNAPALELLRIGLDRECRVPIQTTPDYIGIHLPELSQIKRLAIALAAEGRLAELDGQTNRAARSYYDAIRLGHQASRGGLLIDALVGLACESIGASALEKNVSGLRVEDCRWLIEQLQLIEARRQPAEETLRIERSWSKGTYGFFMWVRSVIAFRTWDPIAKSFQGYPAKQQVASARQARIIMALAARAFELEHGRPPAEPAELVPRYLPVLPRDGATNVVRSGA